jgi:hypothetical protein
MKSRIIFLRLSLLLGLFAILNGCTKEGFVPIQNDFLKKIKNGEYIVAQYSYNQDNLINEVNSTSFYRKFLDAYEHDPRVCRPRQNRDFNVHCF